MELPPVNKSVVTLGNFLRYFNRGETNRAKKTRKSYFILYIAIFWLEILLESCKNNESICS
jgi:hypothetical protein